MIHNLSRQFARRALNCPRASHARRPATRGLASAPPSAFDWQDPLRWQTLLTDEERAISETAEAYCQEKLQPRVLGTLAGLYNPG
jgi:glutaryl-CoA dehydrogenase